MLAFLRKFFLRNLGIKLISLVLALALWFYIVNELHKGTEEERRLLHRILPSEEIGAKKLFIRPVCIGTPRRGYELVKDKLIVSPEYCIVVGTRELLEKIRFAYTMPIDVAGASRVITKTVPLNPIAPGVYMEETLVQVTVPIEKITE